MIPKKNKLFWTVVGLTLFIFLVYLLVKNLHSVEILINKAGIMGVIVIIILYGLFAPTPITTDPLTIISGAVYGPIMGVIISWLGNNVAALVEYYIGRHLHRVTNYKKIKTHLPFGLNRLSVDSPWFLIFGRLIPGYGGKLISIMAGIEHVPLVLYLWTSALTNFLGSLLLATGGFHLIRLVRLFKF